MITLAEEKRCIDSEVVRELHETYAALQNESNNTLEHRLQYYVDKQYELDEELKKDCSVKSVENEVLDVVEETSLDMQIIQKFDK